MNKVDMSVGALVDMIQRKELRLPQLQRRYVWRATRVRDLLDSLYRGYPSGAILVWETDADVDHPVRNISGVEGQSRFATQKLLLDGQQRLTSLRAVLTGEPVEVRGRRRPIEILFNLDHPDHLEEVTEVDEDEPDDPDGDDESSGESDDDETVLERLRRLTFVVSSSNLAALPNWVSVSQAMAMADAEILKRAGVTGFDDPRFGKYAERLKRLRGIRDYMYVMHLLDRTLSYEEVAEIFVRVNSLGVKLRSSDLATAQVSARWTRMIDLLEEFQSECEESNFTIDLGQLVRGMVVFATGQCRFKSISGVSTARLREGWEEAKNGLRFAIHFLRSNAGIEDESLLSSPLFLHAIAYLYQKRGGQLGRDEERQLLQWVLYGSARGYYAGSAETKLDADLARIRVGGTAADLLKNLEQLFGRVRFNEGDIAHKTKSSGLYSLVFLALRAAGAKDWHSGVGISLQQRGRQHTIQHHHIFPKALLRTRVDRREMNEIANLAFIGGSTNRKISATPPSEYLPGIISARGESALAAQCVPLDRSLWSIDRYGEFLAVRRHQLINAVNRHLDNL